MAHGTKITVLYERLSRDDGLQDSGNSITLSKPALGLWSPSGQGRAVCHTIELSIKFGYPMFHNKMKQRR